MTIKAQILQFLRGNDWMYGGLIDRHVGARLGKKESNISRRCRELYKEGKIDRRLVRFNSSNVVQYRLHETKRIQEKDELFPDTLESLERLTVSPQKTRQTTYIKTPTSDMGIMQANNQETLW